MRPPPGWTPRLAEGAGPVSTRLVAALATDIVDGVVIEGERLPPQRALAHQLGIALGTVSKAYAELGLRGLVRGSPGRGMFVSYRAESGTGDIDLAMNMPPPMLADTVITDALVESARRVDADALSSHGPPGGRLRDKRSVANWLAATGLELAPEELVLTQGAQQGIAAALLAASQSGPRATVFTEEVTFPGALSYARLAGHPVWGVPIDHQGMRPELLDAALVRRGRSGGPRPVVYVTPTLHNPTGATMRGARRRAIVQVARRHDALIIEDDVYALSEDRPARALVSLAPERTFYVSSASKAISPAIRLGMIKAPIGYRQGTVEAVRTLGLPVSPLICVLLDVLVGAGVATTVRAAIRNEGARRTDLAREIFGRALFGTDQAGYHVFLPLPADRARSVVAAATDQRVRLTDPAAMMVDPRQRVSGVRLCLGGPTMADLSRGLEIVQRLVADPRSRAV
ncbi:aminotransferase-like domain-containing protein [Nocardioides alcanivorans]|uniref:aminotransferase-like domain-containing protein n=1 Tax=Nocardioides alcanivorans TaxID=2897352 RepID=UPI001F16D6B7|nr:PLP-dependent aminotransferase family protein [Nocardioides alcanivorans]